MVVLLLPETVFVVQAPMIFILSDQVVPWIIGMVKIIPQYPIFQINLKTLLFVIHQGIIISALNTAKFLCLTALPVPH